MARKNSLVENINRRKKAGKSRPKSRSTVSKQAYRDMQRGWPKKKAAKKRATRKQSTKKRTAGKRTASKRTAGKRSTRKSARSRR